MPINRSSLVQKEPVRRIVARAIKKGFLVAKSYHCPEVARYLEHCSRFNKASVTVTTFRSPCTNLFTVEAVREGGFDHLDEVGVELAKSLAGAAVTGYTPHGVAAT